MDFLRRILLLGRAILAPERRVGIRWNLRTVAITDRTLKTAGKAAATAAVQPRWSAPPYAIRGLESVATVTGGLSFYPRAVPLGRQERCTVEIFRNGIRVSPVRGWSTQAALICLELPEPFNDSRGFKQRLAIRRSGVMVV